MAVTQKALEDMVRVIVEMSDPEQIVLFGSRARGESRPGSDVDLLIVESKPFDAKRSRRKEMARLWRALASFPFAKDILVYSRDEVDYWRDSLNNVVARAMREGKVLYERPSASRSSAGNGL
ncbi:MAG: nucleotidyltransferase domain-containing protein [Thermodesulfobacteriota bacterium]